MGSEDLWIAVLDDDRNCTSEDKDQHHRYGYCSTYAPVDGLEVEVCFYG